MAGALNLYSTQWKDRVQTKNVQDQGDSSDDIIVYLTGIDQSHSGIEAELSAQVSEMVRLDFGLGGTESGSSLMMLPVPTEMVMLIKTTLML